MKTTTTHLATLLAALAAPMAAFSAVTPVISGDTYTFTVASGTETYSDTLSGAIKVVKDGAGTLVLGASANTFTGGIEVNGGTLQGTLKALGGKLDVAIGTEAPQPLVSVADGATLSIVSTTCDGTKTARLAKELRVAGAGVSSLGAVQRPSGSGSMHQLFDKITLTGDTTLSAVRRWGFGRSSTLDMGGHTLTIIGGSTTDYPFEFYNGAVTVVNPGRIALASGYLLAQGELTGDVGTIQLDGGIFNLYDRTIPLSWPVEVAAPATLMAGSGTQRTRNIVAGDISIDAKLTLNLNSADRIATLAGGIDGPGELLMNSVGTLYVTGRVDRTIGAFTQSKGNVVLENAGKFCVTNWTVGTQGFYPNAPAAKVAGAWSAVPRLTLVGNSLFTMPKSASNTAATAEKHHLFVGGAASEFGILDIGSGSVVSNDLDIARSAGSVGAVYVEDGGKLYWRGGLNNQGWLGNEGCGFLAVNDAGDFVSEGVITIGRLGNANGNGGFGIVHQKGGSVRTTDTTANNKYLYAMRLARDNNSYGHWYQTGGTSSFGTHVALCYADALLNRTGNEAVVTLSGKNTAMSIGDGRYLEFGVSSNAVTGVLNLNDGATLTVQRIFKNYATILDVNGGADMLKTEAIRNSVAASKFYVNFDGGILKLPAHSTVFNYSGDIYDDPDRVTVHAGGAIVDTSLCTGGTTSWSAPVLKPSGNVLLSVSLPTDSAWVNKYIAPPRVVISGVNQHGATAVAEFDEANQRITSITVTSPGNDVPGDITVTIKSGDMTKTFACPFTVGAPARDGGFTKRGANVLNLNMAAGSPNTYEGPTTVEGGTLKFENGTYPASSPLVLKGGTLALGGYAVTVPSIEGYGIITGSGGVTVTGELRVSCADLFGAVRSIAAQKVTLASGVRLVITDPENLAQYRSADSAVFLTASGSLSGDAPLVDSAADGWRCSKSGASLKFGFPKPFVLVIR